MSLPILDIECLVSDLGLGRFEVLVECRITEESDVITALALAVVLTLEVRVLVLVWLGDDVASGGEEEYSIILG
jgi:hypothetical protein